LGLEEGDSLYDDIPSISSVAANKHALNGRWNASDEEITFSGKLQDCCICFIDMISSTKVSSNLNPEQIGKYYAIFLNSTAIIAKNFGATIIKNAGDSLIYYFPNATKPAESIDEADGDGGDEGKNSLMAFKDVIECSMTIIAARDIVNSKLYEEKLPSLNYRISAEYGTVEFAQSVSSKNQDLFGPTMNFCAKINSLAPQNGMIIGNSLYHIVRSFDDYAFEKVGEYKPPDTSSSPESHANNCIYTVTSNRKKTILNPFSRTAKTKPLQNASSPLVGGGKHGSPNAYHSGSSSSSGGSPKTQTNNKIMLVDDDEDVLFTFKTLLESEGWGVDAFANPQEALRQFERDESYGLVITDIKMPNLNGLELYNKMKSKNSDTRVLFISALDGAEMILSVFPDLTEKNLIKKPVERDEMIKTIKSMLRYGNENDDDDDDDDG
jgi:CheY-like chemotaxis protein/class 3 adenylate cyclase